MKPLWLGVLIIVLGAALFVAGRIIDSVINKKRMEFMMKNTHHHSFASPLFVSTMNIGVLMMYMGVPAVIIGLLYFINAV